MHFRHSFLKRELKSVSVTCNCEVIFAATTPCSWWAANRALSASGVKALLRQSRIQYEDAYVSADLVIHQHINVGSRLVWGSLIVRSFAILIQHPQVRLGVLNCAKLRRQIKNLR